MDFGIKGKVVLITASSKGIGKSAAEEFIKEGCKVAISSSNKENLKLTASQIKQSTGIEPFWIQCDINSEKEIENCVDAVRHNLGDIDILINNCGGPKPGFFEDLDDDDWYNAVDQVLLSSVRFTRNCLSAMKSKNWGRIINVTSISVKQPIDNLLLSNSLRSGVTAFAKTLSNQVGKYNITINNVAPGFTLTSRLYELAVARAKMRNESHEKILAEMANEVPLKRLARPDEIASAILFLASEKAGYITGQTINVDGGYLKSTY